MSKQQTIKLKQNMKSNFLKQLKYRFFFGNETDMYHLRVFFLKYTLKININL